MSPWHLSDGVFGHFVLDVASQSGLLMDQILNEVP